LGKACIKIDAGFLFVCIFVVATGPRAAKSRQFSINYFPKSRTKYQIPTSVAIESTEVEIHT
jgi:hypothetical protein